MTLSARYHTILDEIARCCVSAGRDPEELRLVAVSKTVGLSTIEEAVSVGICDFGENRPDSLGEKQRAFPQATWHFIGNVQSRKIPEIVSCASLIHSIYQPQHLAALDTAAQKAKKIQEILVEVNVSGEQSKAGLAPEQVEDFIASAIEFEHIRVKGFMTMAPQGDADRARKCFDSLAELRSDMQQRFSGSMEDHGLHELSMGMSEDWRQAIEAGATIVRVGRAIFDDSFSKS
ncbi:MAG: YggS family pyridoxal phosphate-dependent enzyme [Raoultibacter sp.]|jgi:pyridoxal phosphate enzyme (YggS family)